MFEDSAKPTRRLFLAASATAGAIGFAISAADDAMAQAAEQTGSGSSAGDAIRPFSVNFPDARLVDLRRRIMATQWPERETVNDASQGVQLATMRELARYWQTDYDWRGVET